MVKRLILAVCLFIIFDMQIYCKKYKLQINFTFFDIKSEMFVVFAIKSYICTIFNTI